MTGSAYIVRIRQSWQRIMSQHSPSSASWRIGRPETYDIPTLAFHWLTALLVVLLFGTSWVWNTWPHNRQWRPIMESSHVSLGILFAILIVIRAVWRLTGSRRLEPESGWSGILSQFMYAALYVLLGLEVALGFWLRWLQGEEFSFFGLFSMPSILEPNRPLAHSVETWHNWAAWALVILAAGHAAAALVHHYILKDNVMSRMLLRLRRSA